MTRPNSSVSGTSTGGSSWRAQSGYPSRERPGSWARTARTTSTFSSTGGHLPLRRQIPPQIRQEIKTPLARNGSVASPTLLWISPEAAIPANAGRRQGAEGPAACGVVQDAPGDQGQATAGHALPVQRRRFLGEVREWFSVPVESTFDLYWESLRTRRLSTAAAQDSMNTNGSPGSNPAPDSSRAAS